MNRIILIFAFAAAASAQDFPSAFRPAPANRAPEPIDGRGAIKRQRPVDIDISLFDRDAVTRFHTQGGNAPSKTIQFNLFDDANLRVVFDKADFPSADKKTVVWSGRVENTKYGQITMAVTGKVATATVSSERGVFTLQHAEGLTHWAQERDPSRLLPEVEPVRVPTGELPPQRAPVSIGDDGSLVDVLVVYTAAARQAAGGTTQIQNAIAIGISETNQGYANSGIVQRVRLAGTAEVTYAETGVANTELSRLRGTTDGFMDDVHNLRNQYGADIVSLWVSNMNDACGIGYLLTDVNADFSSRAFNVVDRTCAFSGNYTFAHELGHNMGATHDETNSGGPGVFSYSYGFQQKIQQPYFRTVMAYACSGGINCSRINYWSKPDGTYSGLATGVTNTNNALTLNNTRTLSANWRQTITGGLTIAPSSANFAVGGGTGTITVSAGAGTTWTATKTDTWITITAGATGSGNGTVSYTVAANTGTAQRSGAITVGGNAFTVVQAGSVTNCSVSAIAFPGTATGTLATSDCRATYRANSFTKKYTFSAFAGQQVSVTMSSTAIDSYLYLLGPTGNLLQEDDDSGGGVNSRVPATGFYSLPSTGVYTIEAASFDPGEVGAFSLSVTTPSNCTFSISPSSRSVDYNLTTGSLAVTATSGCAWSAYTNTSWISLTSSANGTGNGSVTYSIGANTGSSARVGTIIAANQTFTVTQAGLVAGCTQIGIGLGQTVSGTLNSASCASQQRGAAYYAARYSFYASAGQQLTISATSQTLDSYLYLVGPDGRVVAQDDDSGGARNSRIPATGFFAAPTSGTYTIEMTTFDIFSSGSFTLILTGGCSYSVSPRNQFFTSANSTGSAGVTTTSGCTWSASTSTSWLGITAGASGTGGGVASFSVAPNTTNVSRRGTLTVAGTTVYVVQSPNSSACSMVPVSLPQTANGDLASNDCYSIGRPSSGYYGDRYTFSGQAGQTVTLTLDATAFDTYLYLFGPDGALVASDDDSGPGTNSRIPSTGALTLPATGTYTIEATSYTTGRTGGYTLTTAGSSVSSSNGPFRFVALRPCRVVDTRPDQFFPGAYGAPVMTGGSTRTFNISAGNCGIPANARAYSLNFTVVPSGPLSYLSTWPADRPQPFVSTLNSPLGRVVANAAIVPASSTGAISVFVSDTTHVIIDVNGFYAP